ncbi:MAG TPA: DNA mismatch repair endonuclease MutL, partial [Desulfobacterales bacterium]|nr:DNA mismatch repair endonuclease MutL [Desulfobacterales bacterium]
MPRIRILPEVLSNKIAAGEVVERPASVVKELVENALDAGAGRILVDIEEGGRALIRVADDGCGMSRDDALLAIERHATSKLSTDDDLFAIRTLGFRGEALPSIASVSRFCLVSREAASDSGTEITIEGGTLANVAETGAPPGTMISVRDLFFNVPARRKFLKSIATEMAHVTDLLAGLALAWPGVQFRLTHNDRVVKNWPAASDPFERALEVLGAGLRHDLHPVALELEGVAVCGWVSRPQLHRRTADGVFALVNRRHVRDRVVQHALFQGYSQRLVKGQYPLAVLFITVPYGEVDVNVHPAKNEVRFARPGGVHEVIRRAVAQTLYDTDRPGGFRQKTPETNQGGGEQAEGRDATPGAAFGGGLRPVETPEGQKGPGFRVQGSGFRAESDIEHRGGTPLPQENPFGVGGASSPDAGGAAAPEDRGWKAAPTVREKASGFGVEASSLQHAPQSTHRAQVEIWDARGFGGLRVVGQLHNTYIVAEADDGLVLVDQHAAHERVLYDRLARPDAAPAAGGQALLVPETVELQAREAEALERLLPHLRALGLEVEPFGGSTVVVRAVPGFLAGREVRPLLVEIAAGAAAPDAPAQADAVLDFCRQ